MVYVLNVLSEVAPEWIIALVPSEWVERYGKRLEEERLPKGTEARQQYANQVGADGWLLLTALESASTPDPIENAPCCDDSAYASSNNNLSRSIKGGDGGKSQRYRPPRSSPPLTSLVARTGKKRAMLWTGNTGAFHTNL
jgi:hypothetical protein